MNAEFIRGLQTQVAFTRGFVRSVQREKLIKFKISKLVHPHQTEKPLFSYNYVGATGRHNSSHLMQEQ
jgi:hypothetical protein